MKSFIKNVKLKNLQYLSNTFSDVADCKIANHILLEISGINDFFRTDEEFLKFKESLKPTHLVREDIDRREYGDFQTPYNLTDQICSWLYSENIQPTAVIEPTFGKGAFILSSLKIFQSCNFIIGIEIYEAYYWETKFKILDFFLDNPLLNKPTIFLYNADIFKFKFKDIQNVLMDQKILVLGNPPWVTNAELGSLDSNNLPAKSNFKNRKGLDAITGKGNFDICEYIILMMLNPFSHYNGYLAMLAKNSVIKNIVYDLLQTKYNISNLRSFQIDAKKYFNAAVDASLFICKLNKRESQLHCKVSTFVKPDEIEKSFGWVSDKFISNIQLYKENFKYDRQSPYEWRQGVKHDCSKVFELKKEAGKLINGFGQILEIEDDLVYGLAKSSDLKKMIITEPNKFVIITQKRIGEDTLNIKIKYPRLYEYLKEHQDLLNKRKSSIYKNKPPFSIFGVGDYSFKPYKVAVSGLYKEPKFTLLFSKDEKPIMVDDTCYLLGFDKLSEAIFAWALLNNHHIQKLLFSITFLDSKRPFTKDILMRLAIHHLAKALNYFEIVNEIKKYSEDLTHKIDKEKWNAFLISFDKYMRRDKQLELFDYKLAKNS